MDKNNKNRTDLLAAGRKRLQQFRQKKDGGKGSKSSGKASTSERNVDVAADAAATVAKPAEPELVSEQQVPLEEKPRHDSAVELIASSELHSRESSIATEIDAQSLDSSSISVLDEAKTAEAPLTTAEFPAVQEVVFGEHVVGLSQGNESSIDASASNVERTAPVLDNGMPSVPSVETSNILIGGISVDVGVPTLVDSLTPLGSANASEAVEMTSVRGEDQMQEAASSVLEQVDGNNSLVLEGDTIPRFPGGDENAGVHEVSAQVDGRTVRETEPTSEEAQNTDTQSDSPQSLPISDALSSEHVTQHREDSMANGITSGGDVSPYSLSQLAKVVQGLSEDEYRFLVMGRDSADKFRLHGYGSSDSSEGLKEQLYLMYLDKDIVHLQLSEQLEIQREMDCRFVQFVNELSTANLSLKEVRGTNEHLADELARCRSELELVVCGKEELQKNLYSSKIELDEFSARNEELQSELERSKLELSNVVAKLADCRDLVEALQVKNESLNENLTLQAKEVEKLQQEKGEINLENEKLSMELVECKASLELSRSENVKSSEILASMIDERSKTEEERQSFVLENDKLLAELESWKDLVESLRVENANFNAILISASEERSKVEEAWEHSVQETRKLSAELVGYKDSVESLQAELINMNVSFALVTEEQNRLVEENDCLKAEKDNVAVELASYKSSTTSLQVEYSKAVDDMKEVALRLEHLALENATLASSLDLYKAKLKEVDNIAESFPSGDVASKFELSEMSSTEREGSVDKDYFQHVDKKGDETGASSVPEKASSHVPIINLSFNRHQWDISNDAPEFLTLKGHLDKVEEVIQNLEEGIERMHSHSTSLSRSGGKTVSHGISKLIQAFESKAHTDDEESEEVASIESQQPSDSYMLTKEQIRYMREVLKELSLDTENVSKIFKEERDSKMLSDTGLRELRVCHEALEEQSNILEEANIELVVLYEVIKQHLCTVEAKKGELLVKYEGSKQQELSLKEKTRELERKLCGYESRISELQVQFEELYRRSDDSAASIDRELGVLHNDVAERMLLLENKLNATVSDVVEAMEKLDAFTGTLHSTLTGHSANLDIGSHVAASVEAATTLIKNLKETIEAAHHDNGSLFSSHNDLTEKFNELHEKNVLFDEFLHNIYGRLERLIDDSSSSIEESRTEIVNDKMLISLDFHNYDSLMERLAVLLGDRQQLEFLNGKLSSELLDKTKDIEELRKSCLDSNIMPKIIEDIERVVKLDGVEINPAEPASSIMSLIHFLIRNYEDQISLSREILVSDEMKMIELQGQIDQMFILTVTHKNESLVFMESLRSAVEELISVESDRQHKVSELEQSERRVSSIREKLSLAVTKGKGLIMQRDGLKQSLASTSSELENCMHELQLKDARLHEIETKLKTYSEAGERVEALESELSYIRNSATALRESFLLKDSVLQRVEEILEDLELPEHFHSGDIIEKVDWLARSVAGTSLPPNDWDQKSSVGGGPYSDSGFGVTNAWKEDSQPISVQGDDLRRNYDELQSRFYGLAEQNDMLEQSLMERNRLVQRWEEILDKIDMPSQFRSMEPVDRIEWLGGALSEAHEHCDSLQQKIDNLESFCGTLTENLEDSQRRLADMEAALSLVTVERDQLSATLTDDLEDSRRRLADMEDALTSVTRERDHLSATLTKDLEDSQRRLADMETALRSVTREREQLSATLADDLEDYQRKLADMEAALMSVTGEKECLSASVEKLSQDYDIVNGRANSFETENEKLKIEISALEEKLNEKILNEENINHIHSEIKRLQDLVREELQDPDTDELHLCGSSTEYLEKLLRRLTEKYRNIPSNQQILGDAVEEQVSGGTGASQLEMNSRQLDHHEDLDMVVLKKELDETLGDLMRVTDERDRHAESNQSLIREAEALEIRRQELQELLALEEQKSASVKEKLNLAVRKGKSLVQQRDSLKQNINELTLEVERLKSVIELRDQAIMECEQRIKGADSEILFMRNHLAETEKELQEKRQTLSMMMGALAEIDIGSEPSISDPVEKMEHMGRSWHELHAAITSSQLDSSKSKRAAELLLAELNEVQERNDGLQEELSKATMELLELSKEKDLEEATKREALSRLEHFSSVQSHERNKQFSELMVVKSAVEQLMAGFIEINNLVTDVLPKEVELLRNLEATVNSSLKSSVALNIAHQALGGVSSGLVSYSSENKVKLLPRTSFIGSTNEEQFSDESITQLWSFVEDHLQDFTIKVTALKENLHIHSVSLHEQAMLLSQSWGDIHEEMVGEKRSFESIKADIARLESIEKEKDAENLVLRRNISVLYEACKSSIMEIHTGKAMLIEDANVVGNLRYNFGSSLSIDGRDLFSRESLSFSEEYIRSLTSGLLSVVKEHNGLQGEIVEAAQMEMKTTISNLQKELREKDSQKDRICVELASQIREAESTATSYLEELQLAKNQVLDLQGHANMMEQQYNLSQQRMKDLEDQVATSVDLQERVRSLTDALTAKEQEIESLMQALDEEEAQMEDMKNRVAELESLMLQKDLDLENAEASRGKAIKKLSITVNKFDELHHLSATLLSEVEKLQSQVQDRDAEISFLRQEVTRCTEDALLASKTINKGNFDELWDLLTWLDSLISEKGEQNLQLVDKKSNQVHEYKEILQKKMTVIISELKDLREVSQSRDSLLQLERNRVQELQQRGEYLEKSLRDKESQLSLQHGLDDSGHRVTMDSEITEVEPVINKWAVQGTSVAPQVRSLRKVNNDQVAIAIDTDLDSGERLEDEDDDKAHGFKSLTTSRIVPRFTRPVSDLVDGLWVSCDRALMRQPALRLSVILYWAVLHALLAAFVV